MAAWRYQRGSRSFALNLDTPKEAYMVPSNEHKEKGDIVENEDIPPLVEEVVGQLLKILRDEDITTRWSSAKGIGRITDRLSAEFSDEIVENILRLFTPRETCCAWNGACLALAELGKFHNDIINHWNDQKGH